MPMYEYYCSCDYNFSKLLSVSDRDQPTREPCPECGKNEVNKGVSETTMGVDMKVTPDRRTGGDWSRLMDKMRHGTPERMHGQFDKASNRTGGKLGPQ